MKTLSIRLPEPLATWVTKHAEESGRTRSEVIREALERERAGERKSIGEAMAELGAFKGGARDGSTNKKYLEGYGE